MVYSRRSFTLIELLVVLAIIAALLGLLFPALQNSRERSREVVCKNNLRQLSLAFAQLHQTRKQLPLPPPDGYAGGWSYEILQFLEQRPLYELIRSDAALPSIPASAVNRPLIMTCPVTDVGISRIFPIEASRFALGTSATRESWIMFDAPLRTLEPWLTGMEMPWSAAQARTGPHHGGYHYANADGSVRLYVSEATDP